jgi:hypothetical protein
MCQKVDQVQEKKIVSVSHTVVRIYKYQSNVNVNECK